jgi:ribosome-associated toxin RatA of RatAB toxin-antitoxin module
MKSIDGRASSSVPAQPADCFSLLAAVDRYPEWTGEIVHQVTVLERDEAGRPAVAGLGIHVAQSPFGKNFTFRVAVRAEPDRAVWLTRVPDGPADRDELEINWQLEPSAGTEIRLWFHAATALVPRFVPLFGVGDQIASHLLEGPVRTLGPTR